MSYPLRPVVVFAVMILLSSHPAAAQLGDSAQATAQGLDSFVRRALQLNVTPGLSVAIVRDGEVVYLKGFGDADREARRPVTPDTQFYIASTTKSFTGLAASILATRGDLDLDATIEESLPGAAWHEDVAPASITLRDLLTHTHGIQTGGPVDLRLAYTGDHTPALLLRLLRFHGPASTGRAFAYSNLGYNLFGLVLDQRFPGGWKQVLQKEVFDPLGMAMTTAWISRGAPALMAQPYELTSTGPARVRYAKVDATMHAAGGHLSTARDLARYLGAHIDAGRPGRRQRLPRAAVDATHVQRATQTGRVGSYQRTGWGLGWDIADYEGERVLQRSGGFQGFHSHVSFMPERRTGVVILANGGGASGLIAEAVSTYIYDHAIGKPQVVERTEARWRAMLVDLEKGRAEMAAGLTARAARAQRVPGPLQAYAGTYVSEALGKMIWTVTGNGLHVQLGVAESGAEVFDGDRHQFRVELTGSGAVVTFRMVHGLDRASGLEFRGREFVRVE